MAALEQTFTRLRAVLEPYVDRAVVAKDAPGALQLDVDGPAGSRPQMLAAVLTAKASVAFHYMPVYTDPTLLDGLSADLRRRMRGKSCFHFTDPDDPTVVELEQLVGATAPSFLHA